MPLELVVIQFAPSLAHPDFHSPQGHSSRRLSGTEKKKTQGPGSSLGSRSMPLLEMSPNIQESEARARKRSHDEFEGDAVTTKTEEATKDLVLSPKKPSGVFLCRNHRRDTY